MSEERENGTVAEDLGFRMIDERPAPPVQNEDPGDYLGEFLPVDTLRALNEMSEREHEFLQAALGATHHLLGSLREADSHEDLDSVMAELRTLLRSLPDNIERDTDAEAVDILINMTAAVTACGMRSMLLDALNGDADVKPPIKDEEGDEQKD